MSQELLEAVAALPEQERTVLRNKLNQRRLPSDVPKQRMWVAEYCIDLNAKRAAHAVGLHPSTVKNWMRLPNERAQQIRAEVAEGMKARERATELKAEYVREYIHDILELCPADYFTPDENGDWHISRDKYEALPRNVKRLIDKVEFTADGFRVTFVSKQHALGLAAKYTLTQHIHQDTTIAFPWAELAKAVQEPQLDYIEARIQAELNGANSQALPTQPPATEIGGSEQAAV